jgi:hypothetical protein
MNSARQPTGGIVWPTATAVGGECGPFPPPPPPVAAATGRGGTKGGGAIFPRSHQAAEKPLNAVILSGHGPPAHP